MNTKLGGTNHTLASRDPTLQPSGSIFQKPPASLSWLFEKTCMVVGIDVSHPEPGSTRSSTAAIVGSLNGEVSQYVAYMGTQNSRVELTSDVLTEGMEKILNVFKRRNGDIPKTILVYRDGVSEGQFNDVLKVEIIAIQAAIALLGYAEDYCKISFIVCQKGHHTRFFFEDKSEGGAMEYINPCPGICVDSTAEDSSITNPNLNEFFLNSHTAIQGTAKPCKYTLLYDEIGFKISELELMTYWLCYLYARCNKSVSVVTPVYYAHWVAKRAMALFKAGATNEDMKAISNEWSKDSRAAMAGSGATMFFI